MTDLHVRIARLIAAQGPLSIAQFMTIALHDPKSGYYATRDPFGRTGDFITAPEISQMFGELLGLWFAQVWRDAGEPSNVRLVELGPGRGTLMADMLRAVARVPGFLASVNIVLVEASPALTKIQQERLAGTSAKIDWVARLEDALHEGPLLLAANEFFDALPIRQYVRTERGWCERMVVAAEDDTLAFALAPVPMTGLSPPAERGEAEAGAVYEISPASDALAEEIAGHIAKWGGAALVVDYGYTGTGFGDTLQAVHAHKPCDVLATPGEADLSAHVDFTRLAAAAMRAGAISFGPQPQGRFLETLGLAQRAAQLARDNPAEAQNIEAAVARLTSSSAMGALFKAFAIMEPHSSRPAGF